jgi:hypothetical protein
MGLEQVSVYEELALFLANLSPSKVLAFKASEEAQIRVSELLEKNKSIGLSEEEKEEMGHFMTFEHIVRLAKAKALLKIKSK